MKKNSCYNCKHLRKKEAHWIDNMGFAHYGIDTICKLKQKVLFDNCCGFYERKG